MDGRRVPEVNLLLRQQGPPERSSARRYLEWVLMVVVIAIWIGVGVAIAVLLGWHPDLGP